MSAPVIPEDERAAQQRADDVFRDRLLGGKCFCGANGGMERGKMDSGATVAIERRCSPLKCLAHGYCEAHMTPVAAQMSVDDKARIARRCGIDINKIIGDIAR